MNENDRIRPDVPLSDADASRIERPRMVYDSPPSAAMPLLIGLAVFALLAVGMYFWPRDTATTNVTENAPRVERPNAPTMPPANKPTPAQPQAPK